MYSKLLLVAGSAFAADATFTPAANAVCDGAGNVALSLTYVDARLGTQTLMSFKCGDNALTGQANIDESSDEQTLNFDNLYTACGVDQDGSTLSEKYNVPTQTISASIGTLAGGTLVSFEDVEITFSCTFSDSYTVTASEYDVTPTTTTVTFSDDFNVPESEFSLTLTKESYAAAENVSATAASSGSGNFNLLDATVSLALGTCTVAADGADTFTLVDASAANCGAQELAVKTTAAAVEGKDNRSWTVSYYAFILQNAGEEYTVSCGLNVCLSTQLADAASDCAKATACIASTADRDSQ